MSLLLNRPFFFFEFQKLSLLERGKVQNLSGEMSFICMKTKNHILINGFALSLALKQRLESGLSTFEFAMTAELKK